MYEWTFHSSSKHCLLHVQLTPYLMKVLFFSVWVCLCNWHIMLTPIIIFVAAGIGLTCPWCVCILDLPSFSFLPHPLSHAPSPPHIYLMPPTSINSLSLSLSLYLSLSLSLSLQQLKCILWFQERKRKNKCGHFVKSWKLYLKDVIVVIHISFPLCPITKQRWV